MSTQPLELRKELGGDNLGEYVANTWHTYNTNRLPQLNGWKELRNYVFATDTTTTTNNKLPWKNKTTLPKLCQIRDNLHSNYISAIFPSDDWLKWEAHTPDAAKKDTVRAIEAYMSNKTRMGNFKQEIDKCVYDYIDYGNAFITVDYVKKELINDNEDRIKNYVGPWFSRISPIDIVFNPLATSFQESFKIIRRIKTIGALKSEFRESAELNKLEEILSKRKEILRKGKGFGLDTLFKEEALSVDGFGSYYEYLQSGFIEVLHFYGDIYNQDTEEYQTARHIIVLDRMFVLSNEAIPSYLGHPPIYHVGWRMRPDNIWAQGPLDNLVGMQYRMDHLENMKADAMDIAVHPPLVIAGEVEDFEWGPNAEIHIDENGSVTELGKNTQWVITANNDIAMLEQRMELYAGAPREAMGFRSPGEKTMFEVQQLQNASSRVFTEKTTNFEIELSEKALNAALEISKRNLDEEDLVSVIDSELGVQDFIKINKNDITSNGVIRPVGARHFTAQAQLVQNLTTLSNTPIWQQIGPHVSSKKLAALVEETMRLSKYDLVTPYVAISEQQEQQALMNQASEDLEVQASVDTSPIGQ